MLSIRYNAKREAIKLAKQYRIKKLDINPQDLTNNEQRITNNDLGELLAVNFEMANYEYNDHKTKPPEGWSYVEEINFNKKIEGIERGQIIGEEVNKCRSLANTPPGLMTPLRLAEA